ncbi:MAG: flavodoxin domain-containing protein [Candidatus Caenarcaniphilales bacterium]|nr:flavodoxin domain-containing protein [Candidatus Caenarcaniphilales bacterium]
MGKKIAVLYGTETGNSEGVADEFAKAAKSKGHEVELGSIADKSLDDLKNFETSVFVISTWGDGDPPGDAEGICNNLFTSEADELKLDKMRFHVLALGDKSYVDYCGCGRRLDGHLERLGASRFLDRKDLDTDFEDHVDAWKDEVLKVI